MRLYVVLILTCVLIGTFVGQMTVGYFDGADFPSRPKGVGMCAGTTGPAASEADGRSCNKENK